MGAPLGARPPLTQAAQAVITDREQRGLALPGSGPDARQAGSVFLNPVITPVQEAAVRRASGPVHRDQSGGQRTSAGWLLEQCGYRPGSRIGPGVYCSATRTLLRLFEFPHPLLRVVVKPARLISPLRVDPDGVSD
jgi:UDP-N-acetylmuramate dehydrogenase